jgi:hypothetical protein
MLRRRFLALLLCLFAAGFAFAGQAASAAMQGDQVCTQHEVTGGDCGGDGMAANACTVHCAAGACVVSAFSVPQLAVPAVRPPVREAVLTPDCQCAPDTAPPKAFIS